MQAPPIFLPPTLVTNNVHWRIHQFPHASPYLNLNSSREESLRLFIDVAVSWLDYNRRRQSHN